MQLSRSTLIALIGVVLVAGVLIYTRTQGGEQEIAPEPTPQVQTGSADPESDVVSGGSSKGRRSDNSKVLPRSVKRALARHRVIVLFLRSSGGAEQRLMRRAVNGVRGQSGVTVITDSARSISRYSRLTDEISRTPVIVVVGRKRHTRIFEGYVDEESVRAAVLTARRS